MEYRTWTSIPDMPFSEEHRWLPVIEHLERDHPDLGPIASWDDETTMLVVLTSDEPDSAAAAGRAAGVVNDALLASRLSGSASVLRVERTTDAAAA